MEFKIIKNDEDVVMIEVVWENELDRISQPHLTGREKYIKVTKGSNKPMITLYDEDHNAYFSYNQSTSVTEDLRLLFRQIFQFLSSKGINPKLKTEKRFNEIIVFPPQKGFGDNWSIEMGGKHLFFEPSHEAIEEVFIGLQKQEEYVSESTGARSFKATFQIIDN